MSDSPPGQSYRLSIRRPVTVSMMFLCIAVFGWKSYQELPVSLMPDISYPTLTVRTEYEGAAPEDVEKLVTRPLEERLSVVAGVVELSSVSSPGLSEIIMEFTWGTDMNTAMQDVREGLDMFNAPQGVNKKPIILRYDPTLDPVMRIAVRGRDLLDIADPAERDRIAESDLTNIREAAERQLKGDLEAEIGIAQVVVKGGREEEIQILVDAERLKNVGLRLEQVVAGLQQQNINLSGGSLKEGKTEYLVRTLNEFKTVEEIRGVVVRTAPGQSIRLEDIASIEVGRKERKNIVRVNGQEAVELEFYKEGDANTVEVCNTLKDFFNFERKQGFVERIMLEAAKRNPSERGREVLEEIERKKVLRDQLRTRLPDYAEPALVTDQSRFIEASIKEVQDSAIGGTLISLLILYLYLREWRSTIIIGISIPISIIATFVPLFMLDVSLNVMSLGGLAMGVGMVVDNSIVVLESIFRCRQEGDGPVVAAERGTREVAGAVTASTLTSISVFFPIVFVEGIAGQLFGDLAMTVTFSTIASLIVALYLIPMIAARGAIGKGDGKTSVWLLRALRDGRAEGRGFAAAIAAIPRYAGRYARAWLREAWGEIVLPAWDGTRATAAEDGTAPSVIQRAGWMLVLPLVTLLFAVQCILRMAVALLVTVLFAVFLLLGGIVWLIGRAATAIFYIPAQLFEWANTAVLAAYEIVLRQALHFAPLVLAGVIALTIHAAYVARDLGTELIPSLRQGEFNVRIEAPPGTRLEDTEMRARAIEGVLTGFPEVESVTMEVGREEGGTASEGGENIAELTVKLADPDRTIPIQDQLIERMREKVVASTSDTVTFSLPTLFSFKTAVEVQIYGEELEELRRLGNEAMARLENIEGLKDVELSLKKGYPEVIISMDRDLLATKGLQPAQISQRVRGEVQGDVATTFSRGGEKIDVRVRSDQQRLSSVDDLRTLSVAEGFPPVPLSAVAKIETREGPSEIRRIDQRQVVIITANVERRDLGSVARDIHSRLEGMPWPDDSYSYMLGGQQRELETSYGGMIFALGLAVFLVYVVMACQFESYGQPALIMVSVPLAFIGVVYALAWGGYSLDVSVFIGGIVLSGIVVNAAIVLIDYVNQLRERGLKKVEALVEAGKVRYRPIMMTTLTTILGLLPMAFATGEGAELRGPMAVTIMAGLTMATVLQLIIVPVLYNIFAGRDPA